MNIVKYLIFFVSLIAALPTMAQTAEIKDVLGKYFLVGTAVDTNFVSGHDPKSEEIVTKNFNSIVAENCMKGEEIHPDINRYEWTYADRTVNWGLSHNQKVIGHCLVWHSQAPKWMFTDEKGNTVSRETLIGRMYSHIMTVVGRYRGKILGWDVVNEAINDDGSYRETPYYKIIGPEYIPLAFMFAHEADPEAELYLNDYSMSKPGKRETYCRIINAMKSRGIRIDAIGMQSHHGYNYPDWNDFETSIKAFAATEIKVQFTEVDINMLPNPESFGGAEISQKYQYDKSMNPYTQGLTKKAEKLFEQRYLDFFRIIERNKASVKRVTFWGVTDRHSWLNDWPIKGRTNYPLLFDRNYQPKTIMKEIINMFN